MARDWLLLEGFAGPDEPRLRVYGWARPAWTFGYRQSWALARAEAGPDVELVRRPTGGGLVDHRADWTYALVLPAKHALARMPAREGYRIVHTALAGALRAAGVPAELAPEDAPRAALAACFARAEARDVVRGDDGRKLAGAAQRRRAAGVLVQGSVSRATAAEVRDWALLGEQFAQNLAKQLGTGLKTWDGVAFAAAALAAETTRFGSAAWNERR